MRFGVNARFLLKGKLEGIGMFTHEVMQRVVRLMPQHQFVFFFDRQPDEQFIYADNVQGVVLSPQARHPILWYLWFEQAIPRALKKYEIDCFISSDGYLSLKTKVPTLLTIHDLAFEHFGEQVPYLVRKYYKYYTPKFAKHATQISTVSEFTKQDIMEQYAIDGDKISVIGNGSSNEIMPLSEQQKQQVRRHYADGCQYFVYIGAIHPRKNIEGLLKAYDAFKKQYDCNIKLILVGRWAWQTKATKAVFESMQFADEVITLGHLQRAELNSVLASAMALVYPSFFEGFGIPLLEAMHAEVPIIASDRSSLPEVGGEAAIYINPEKVEQITNAMLRVAKDLNLRLKLIESARLQRNKFSWDKSAAQFVQLMEQTAQGN